MGPNGSGKSTLAQVLAGHPAYTVTGGTVLYDGNDLLDMEPEERAQAGVFLAFQYPVEIPGVTNAYFLRAAYNEIRKARGETELDPIDFYDLLEEKLKVVQVPKSRPARSITGSRAARRSGTRSSRWRCSSRGSRSSTKPIRDSTSTRSGSWPTASTRCVGPIAR
jgi:Fe-S cluster assembly ATPase SufC